jgi:hypothetical protein
MMARTTFITVEVVGPRVPFAAVCKAQPETAEYAHLARLFDRSNTIKVTSRPGAWTAATVKNLAQKGGAVLRGAYTIARDSKGYMQSTQNNLV